LKKNLRSGYTTGACAAAAAKAATLLLVRSQESGVRSQKIINSVDIPFPDGSRHKFRIQDAGCRMQDEMAWASVIKDAGDDPDVTNGAEIMAEIKLIEQQNNRTAEQQDNKDKSISTTGLLRYCSIALEIKGGKGVGIVTKPGLPVPVGKAAINPVPRQMIREALMEAILEQQNSRATE